MQNSQYEAHAYDYEKGKVVYFHSSYPHCLTCLYDDDNGGAADDKCCCYHQYDYSCHRDKVKDSDIIKEVEPYGKV